ncbi:amidohydrolase family protein, partial [Candidatus Micrarchaeota archaeon]|nr:amidohydrolase family protein [Candidatus Micrarchaeota archaeon]
MLKHSKIVLKQGLILSDPRTCVVEPHRVTLIEDGRLKAVNIGENPTLEGLFEIDCSGCLIMPGLINGHTHGAMSLLRGLADDLPLERWLNDYIFPTESRFVNPDFVNLGTRLACVEMALNGITTFADGYFFMEQSAQAAQDVGLRAVIAQGILDPPTPDAEKGLWQRRVEEFLENCINTDTIQPALFCHSPYLCGPDTYKSAWNIAGSNGLKLFSHVAETVFEVDQVRIAHNMTPVYHLNELGVLGPDFISV